MKKPGSASSPLWYKDAILYELHVRAYCDSNGDGIGDFPGLVTKLDYLQDLGVTCLWLLPFFPSPLKDDGYDVADYTSVHPSFGTLDDFQHFLDEAHARGMQVLIELVMNHSSDQHPWFQRARHAPRGSPERDFYVWSDDDTRFAGVPIIFKDTEKSNWAWDPVAGQFYWHRFFSHQPDLNFDNPLVLEEMLNVMRFWLDRGVDGLRLDAIPYLIERDGTRCENLPETHAILKRMRAIVDSEYTNRFFLAEANQLPAEVRPYFGNGDECHMAFHFPLMPRIYVSIRQEDRLPIVDILQQTPEIPETCQWGLFLRNHDELTLEMVTDDERDYLWLAYSQDPKMRVNVGIRRRLAPLLDNNRQRIELLNSILFSFPGTPIIYYGDEIGMGDNVELGDRNGVRTPMQWNSGKNAGFSTAPPEKLYSPVIDDPMYGYQAVNVEEQLSSPSSLLQWMRNMIGLRKLFGVFGRGTMRFLHPSNRKVLAYIREYQGHSVLCVANLSRFAQPAALDMAHYTGYVPMEVFGYNPFPPVATGPYVLTLAPYAFLWFELEQMHTAAENRPLEHLEQEVAEQQLVAATPAEEFPRSPESARVEVTAPGAVDVLLHIAPLSAASLRNVAASLAQAANPGAHFSVTVAFPLHNALGIPDEDSWRATEAELTTGPLQIRFAPYTPPPGALPLGWPYSLQTFQQVAQLAQRNHARAVLFLSAADAIDWAAAQSLTAPVLRDSFDLGIANYMLSRFEGLFNSAILRPLICTLFSADIRQPLAPDVALSSKLLDSLVHLPAHGGMDDAITWPSLQAIRESLPIAQVTLGPRDIPRVPGADVSAVLTRVLHSLFDQIELSAGYWQRPHQLYAVRNVEPEFSVGPAPPPASPRIDVSPMMEQFHLGLENLQDVWSQILSPRTLLGVKRAATQEAFEFKFSDKLWVRVVYDFLAAYRSRTVNRAHLFGALLPLYMGWAASHLLEVESLSDAQAEEMLSGLVRAFEEDKAYLMARWRWPDRFTP